MVPGFSANPSRPLGIYVFRPWCRAGNKATDVILPIAAKFGVYGIAKHPMCDVHHDRIAARHPRR